jgi:hypothetical protein
MRKVVIVAMGMDEANRRVLEDTFFVALNAHGVEAVRSYELFRGNIPQRELAEKAVHDIGADGVLTAAFKGTEQVRTLVPYGLWGGYSWGSWGAYGPAYYDAYVYTDKVLSLETTLWDGRQQDRVVWAALTNTTNPSTGTDFVDSVTEKVIPRLAAEHLIPPGPTPKK